ncbi:MAG: hypothetical protein WAX77_03290 [Methylococcaceae bacterium]
MSTALDASVTAQQALGEKICEQLRLSIDKLGFSAEESQNYPVYQQASYQLIHDPYTGKDNLKVNWLDTHKQRIGFLQFNSDNSFYAEYDVVKPHPKKPQWFVEAVSAWGDLSDIKTEAKLLAIPE